MNRVLVRLVLATAGILSLGVVASEAWAGTVVQFDLNYSVSTGSGSISSFQVELFDTEAPITVTNFLQYVNNHLYDNTIIHRDALDFVMQGGGFTPQVTGGTITALNPITSYAAIQNEFSATRSNLTGTIAMAKLSGDPNSATNQWFVNLGDNSANLDNQNGGFTVFGKVLGDGMTLINAINSLPQYDLSQNFGSTFTEVPLFNNGAEFVTVTKAAVVAPPVPTPKGSLTGFVYLDANHDGVMDALDYAIADALVTIRPTGSNTVLATVRTGKDGTYTLGNLAAGTYTIAMQTPCNLPGQDDGTQQIVVDQNGNVVSTGNIGTVGQNVVGNIPLGTDQAGRNFSFAEAAYPVALMSARMLLNDNVEIPHMDATALGTTASPVPEPGTLVLLAAGGLFLGGLARRRRIGR